MDDFSYEKAYPITYNGSELMKEEAIAYIKEKKPGLAFFAWDYPDRIGHTIGWYTDDYMSELTHIDGIIKGVVDSCIEAGIIDNTLFVIVSDHGGHGISHGEALISDLETPFIMFGKGTISEPSLTTFNTASLEKVPFGPRKPTCLFLFIIY